MRVNRKEREKERDKGSTNRITEQEEKIEGKHKRDEDDEKKGVEKRISDWLNTKSKEPKSSEERS